MDKEAEAQQDGGGGRVPWLCSCRLGLALMAFFGFLAIYTQRVGMSVAIVCMVNHTALSLRHQIISVRPPLFLDHEYQYPPALTAEPGPIELYDGSGDQAEVRLSEHFQVREFLAAQRAYFRLDTHLLTCLQDARTYLRAPIEVLSGFRSQSINIADWGERHARERHRQQSGQAARLGGGARQEELARAVMLACAGPLRMAHRTLSIGVHPEGELYVEVRRSQPEELKEHVQLWNAGGDAETYQRLEALRTLILTGGPPLVPHSWTTACGMPELGLSMPHYEVQVRPSCRERSREFCAATKRHRQEWVEKIKTQMRPILGLGDHPAFLQNPDVANCIAGYCGSCHGAGATWRHKVEACAGLLQSIKQHTYRELRRDAVTFFNTDNSESSVQGLACRRGRVCLENTQVYSVFAPLVMATYQVYEDRAQEERLYDSRSNPSPLIDLIEQDMAVRAQGEVQIFLDYDRDLTALKKVVKGLMVYNRDVSKLVIWRNETVNEDMVYEHIQQWIEVWRSDSCPSWSRAVMAPYEVRTIPAAQVLQSMRDGKDRNDVKMQLRNWEIEWIRKL